MSAALKGIVPANFGWTKQEKTDSSPEMWTSPDQRWRIVVCPLPALGEGVTSFRVQKRRGDGSYVYNSGRNKRSFTSLDAAMEALDERAGAAAARPGQPKKLPQAKRQKAASEPAPPSHHANWTARKEGPAGSQTWSRRDGDWMVAPTRSADGTSVTYRALRRRSLAKFSAASIDRVRFFPTAQDAMNAVDKAFPIASDWRHLPNERFSKECWVRKYAVWRVVGLRRRGRIVYTFQKRDASGSYQEVEPEGVGPFLTPESAMAFVDSRYPPGRSR